MQRTTKRKWIFGCVSAVGVLVLLSGLAIVAFFNFMDALNKVSPASTQIVLYNDTNERLRIDRILYGTEEILKDDKPILEVYNPKKFTRYDASLFRNQTEMLKYLSIWYTGISSGKQRRVEVYLGREPDRPVDLLSI